MRIARRINLVVFLLVCLFGCGSSNKTAANLNTSANVITPIAQPQRSPIAMSPSTTSQPDQLLKHNSKIKVTYNKFNDVIEVTTPNMPYIGPPRHLTGLSLLVDVIYDGKAQTGQPKFIGWHIISASMKPEYTLNRSLIVIADGQRYNLGEMYLKNSSVHGGYVLENLVIVIPNDTFLKIANAQKIEMQVGYKEFKMDENIYQTLRDLASRITW